MDNKQRIEIHQLVQDFLKRINQHDQDALLIHNQVTQDMLEELYEELNYSFDSDFDLSIIPIDELPKIMPINKPLFNIEAMDDGDLIVECNIYNFGKITDLKFQAYIEYKESQFTLFYPLFKA